MFEEIVIEIFSSKMGVSSYCLNCEYTIGDCEKRNIECSTSKIENENIFFLRGF
jgi:hypothetical protein